MKKLRIAKALLSVIGIVAAVGLASAQEANSRGIVQDYLVGVSPAHDQTFRNGVEKWETCLKDHGASRPIYAYDAATGNLNRYTFLVPYASWADMDKHSAAGKACHTIFVRDVKAYSTGAWGAILKPDMKASYDPNPREMAHPRLWVVTSFTFKMGKSHDAMGALHSLAEAAAKKHWDNHFIGDNVLLAGPRSADFLIAGPNKSWADIGEMPNPSTRKLLQAVYGKASTKALIRTFDHSVRKASSTAWAYDKKLSFVPRKG